MKKAEIAAIALLIMLPPSICLAQEVSFKRSPPFHGDSIPSTPQQSAPWNPPQSRLPTKLVSAVGLLFEQGLADPRGCEYRDIEVGTGDCWRGDGGVASTRGWVLPDSEDAAQRFAVCWNGLVYPLVSVGERRGLAHDIGMLIEVDGAARAKYEKEHPDREFPRRLRQAAPEAMTISHKSMLPIKVALLVRLGEAELAEQLYAAWRLTDTDALAAMEEYDPYLSLARDWAWAAFDRAVCAHMRADDKLALASAEQLVPAWRRIEAAAEQRGFRPQRVSGVQGPHYLRFLIPITSLLADQRRRAAEPSGKPKNEIDALISDLENVDARQWGQPGGVGLGSDPRVQAAAEAGHEAIEPLLRCLETDSRLTRSVSFHRDFFVNRHLIPVQSAAYVALSKILNQSFTEPQSGGGYLSLHSAADRRQLARRIRSHVSRRPVTPPVEQ